MFFGSMVFKPVRAQRKQPPGTDRVLNWAAYGLWEDQNKHLLSDKEVADKKKLNKAASNHCCAVDPQKARLLLRRAAGGTKQPQKARRVAGGTEQPQKARRAQNARGKGSTHHLLPGTRERGCF
jgi:hypothetical protein